MPSPDELRRLLENPNETLAVEYKSWLNITDTSHKATLAKAAIALANHGGGIIVLGMRGDAQDGGGLASRPRPVDVRRYTQDDINAAINRFVDPAIHCELLHARHAASQVEHAFVIVPTGLATPVMSKRECQGVIASQRCYIRKPGPRSEEPLTGEEWRNLIDRCVRSGRESMLDAIRYIVQGYAGAVPAENALVAVRAFAHEGLTRWRTLTATLPVDDPARMSHGFREITFEIRNSPPAPTLVELRRRLQQAEAIRLTGWPPFLSLERQPFAPRIVDGQIETWLGQADENRIPRDPAHCDFWRATVDGRLFMIRGYEEDGLESTPPGTVLDISLPIWRTAEPLLHVARIARHFGEDSTVLMTCRYTGINNRTLTSIDNRRRVFANRRAADNEVEISLTANVADIEDNLAELLLPALRPLYERFDFFDLPMNLVVDELASLRRGRF